MPSSANLNTRPTLTPPSSHFGTGTPNSTTPIAVSNPPFGSDAMVTPRVGTTPERVVNTSPSPTAPAELSAPATTSTPVRSTRSTSETEPTAAPATPSAAESAEEGSTDSTWTWRNILPKVLIAIATITLAIALFNTIKVVPGIFQANGVLAAIGKTGLAFISNIGKALLYVVVTPFVATYEAVRFIAKATGQFIKAGAEFLWAGVKTGSTWLYQNILAPTGRFLQPAAEAIFNGIKFVVVKTATLIKDVVVWSFNNVIIPIAKAIQPALKAVWDYVLYPVLKGIGNVLWWTIKNTFWVIGKTFEFTFKALGWLYTNALAPVSRAIRSAASFLVNAIKPAAIWLYQNLLAPVGSAIGTAVGAVYHYAIRPVGQAIGTVFSEVASGIASTWQVVSSTISGLF